MQSRNVLTTGVVTVACFTYNQEKYIGQALESFLAQKTTFSFEIIVHDDCSTDSTQEVIKLFHDRFPDKVKFIFQEENQYSKGKNHLQFVSPVVGGEYIALCDGDDYWTDIYKLQKQFDELEDNKDVDLAFHPCIAVNEKGDQILNKDESVKMGSYYGSGKRIFSLDDIILGTGGMIPTSSIMFRKECVNPIPNWLNDYAPVGDVYIQILFAKRGGGIYIPLVGSAYRQQSIGCWSHAQKKSSGALLISQAEGHAYCFDQLILEDNRRAYHTAAARELYRLYKRSMKNKEWLAARKIIRLAAKYNGSKANKIKFYRGLNACFGIDKLKFLFK